MKRDLITKLESSFLSAEKDTQTILWKLFEEFPQHGNKLKKLLVINTPDCLEANPAYDEVVRKKSVKNLVDEHYVKFVAKLKSEEFAEMKSCIVICFDDFTPNETNPQFRDCNIIFDVICHTDYWDVGDYRIRPLQICGYIDGLLNNARLSGIGTLNFLAAGELILDDEFSGYTLVYRAIHGFDDKIPGDKE